MIFFLLLFRHFSQIRILRFIFIITFTEKNIKAWIVLIKDLQFTGKTKNTLYFYSSGLVYILIEYLNDSDYRQVKYDYT